jgi:DNA-binding MarR family transcriptional regulator
MSEGAGVNNRAVTPRLSPAMSSRRLLVLVFVRDYIQRHGGSPSLREIANAMAISTVSVKRHLDKLIDQGELSRTPGTRGLRLPTMREAAVRCLREHGFLIDEDLLRIDRQRVTEKQLLPPPVLSYRSVRASGGRGDEEDGRRDRKRGSTGRAAE